MWLTQLSITRPVTILMVVLALVVMGLLARSRMPLALYPDVEFPMLVVSTVYPGTGPEEMETLITKKIEDSVSSISGLKKLTSTSSEGVSMIRMEFEIGTSIDTVMADVRSKIDVLRASLPADAKAPQVIKLDVQAMPVISLSISSPARKPIEVREIADDIIKDRLSQLPGVAAVTVTGGAVREVRVQVDKSRLEAYGLNIAQVTNALKAENLNLPTGSVEESTRTAAVRVMGEFTSPEQIRYVRIPNAAGNPNLTVGDVARVWDTETKVTGYTRVDRGSSVALTVQKQSDGNTVDVVDEVRKELGRLTGKDYSAEGHGDSHAKTTRDPKKTYLLPEDIEVSVSMDQSTFINDTLHDVNSSLVEGAILAVLIVFLFLHTLRGTFIVALAIPTSMISAFLVINSLGFSMNMMSMLGLSLSVGILVDDSIVVLENIHRHLQMGKPPKEAAIAGRTEIGLAALTITMVDVVVFVPIAFMGGIVGQFFRQFGITVATATLFSLFISFTLTPMLASRWLKPHDREEEEEHRQSERPGLFRRFVNGWERLYGHVEQTYRGILDWSLGHRPLVICMGLMIFLASVGAVMPQPSPVQWGAALPLVALAIAIGSLLWWFVSTRHGRSRWLLGLLLVPVTLLGITGLWIDKDDKHLHIWGLHQFLTMKLGLTTQVVTLMTGIIVVGIIGLLLSRTRPGAPARDDADWPVRMGAPALPRANAATRPATVWALVCLLIVVLGPGKLGFEFLPMVDNGQFGITVEHEVGTSLEVTDATAREIEDTLLESGRYPEIKTLFAKVGNVSGSGMAAIFGGASAGDTANFDVEIKKIAGWEKVLRRLGIRKAGALRSTPEVVAAINKEFAGRPGVKVTATQRSSMGSGEAPINIEVSGSDYGEAMRAAEQVEQIVKDTEGSYGVERSTRLGRPELRALIDRDRAAQYGLSVAQVAASLRASLEGDTSTKYREGGKEYDIRVVLPEDQRARLQQVPHLVVGTSAAGRPVYLADVCVIRPDVGPTKVERSNRQRAISVKGFLKEGATIGNLRQVVDEKLDAAGLRSGAVSIKWAGQAEEMGESFGNMGVALLLSILLVVMLMAALFESLLSPLIIMLAVPQAMAGALLALAFTGGSLSIMSMIGIIMLVGLVTKNAILMVDYTNTLRKEHGLSRTEALRQAGPTRLRPILMTTLAMIFGMMPTAIALANGSEMRQPMAIAVIGGLALSMFLTLLMVPVFYEIMDDFAAGIGRAKDALLRALRV